MKISAVRLQIIFTLLAMLNAAEAAIVHGRFQNEGILEDLKRVIKNSSINAKTEFTARNSSLFDIISLSEDLKHNVRSTKDKDNRVYTDVARPQEGIIRETILHESGGIYFNSLMNGIDKVSFHQHMVDEMMLFLESSFIAEQILTVFTDQSILGEITRTVILQKSILAHRKISHIKVITENSSQEEIAKSLQGNLFAVDCEGKLATKILRVANQVGYTGHVDGVSWVFSQRTTDTLPLSCSLPEGHYFGIKTVKSLLDANYVVRSVKKCENHKSQRSNLECNRAIHGISKVSFVRLWTRLDRSPGKVWMPLKVDGHEKTHNNGNPFWPHLRVAVANTFQPWITIVDFEKTDQKEPFCGLHGKYGYRYANSTTNLTVPICAYGLAIDIIRYLESKHEVVGVVHVSRDGLYGGYNESSGKATGMVAEILNNEADVAMDLMEEPSRRKAIEFTKPYEVTYHGIAYIQSKRRTQAGVFAPFSTTVWAVIISLIAGLVLLIWFLERFSPYGHIQKNKRILTENEPTFGIHDSMEYIWGTLCCGEIISIKPVSTASRITAIFISFVFIMIVAVYSANLISSFVVFDDTQLITGLKDPKIIDEKSKYKSGTQLATATANYLVNHPDERVRKVSKKLTYYNSYKECIDALKSGEVDFIMSDYLSLTTTASLDTECTFKVIPADSNFAGLGLSFKKGSPWKRKLNIAAVSMADSGEKDRLFKYWFQTGATCKVTSEFYALGLHHVANLFIAASCGVGGCLIIIVTIYIWIAAQKCHASFLQASKSSANKAED